MKPLTFTQTRYMAALRLKARTKDAAGYAAGFEEGREADCESGYEADYEADYIQGRMTGVCYGASKQGYAGDDLSIRLQLLGEVLDAK